MDKEIIREIVREIIKEMDNNKKISNDYVDKAKLVKTLKLMESSAKKRKQRAAVFQKACEMRGIETFCEFLISKIENGEFDIDK